MNRTDLVDEILTTFSQLFDEALATATGDGRPSARTVLLKAYDARGFVLSNWMLTIPLTARC